jgi:hypothetical protein
MKAFRYVGPKEIAAYASTAAKGTLVRSRAGLIPWLERNARFEGGWATFVVSLGGDLLVAPRRSEHVACAGGERVLAAGEIRFDLTGTIVEITNNSTGYCPSDDSWDAVRAALDAADLPHPPRFTLVVQFRRCPSCGERNLVKDGWYACAACDAALPREWNFDADAV